MIDISERNSYVDDDEPGSSNWVKENFVVGDVLGSGTFGKVYTVECRRKPGTLLAMKELVRGSQPKYIATELSILQKYGGAHNIMQVHAAHRDRDRVFIVMDHFPHDPIKEILSTISHEEVLDYMANLFLALKYLHQNGIIHRDVKPANFLYNRKLKKYALIDFGLSHSLDRAPITINSKENTCIKPPLSPRKARSSAKRLCISAGANEEETPDVKRRKSGCAVCAGRPTVCPACSKKQQKNVNKAGTPGFRAPEILLKLTEQTPLLDVWSAGVTMLSLLSRRHPVMRPADDMEAITQIAVLLGSEPLTSLADKYDLALHISPPHKGVDLIKLVRCAGATADLAAAEGAKEGCIVCTRLIYDNRKGRCFCRDSEEQSVASLPSSDPLGFAVESMRKCLEVDPSRRYTAEMMYNLLATRSLYNARHS